MMFLEFTDFISGVSEPVGVSHGRGTADWPQNIQSLTFLKNPKIKCSPKWRQSTKNTKTVCLFFCSKIVFYSLLWGPFHFSNFSLCVWSTFWKSTSALRDFVRNNTVWNWSMKELNSYFGELYSNTGKHENTGTSENALRGARNDLSQTGWYLAGVR